MSIHLSPRSVTGGVRPWPCSISIHLSHRFVTAGVLPFPLALYSFVSQVISVLRQTGYCWGF